MNDNKIKLLIIDFEGVDELSATGLPGMSADTIYETDHCSGYEGGLSALLDGRHDICLLNYEIGETDGIELLETAIEKGCRIPIIVMSSIDDDSLDVEAMEKGAADFLVKGAIGSSALGRSIRHAIANGRTLETLRESENRFRSVVESANDAIITTDQSGNIISWNHTAQTIFGYSQAEILGKLLSTLFPASYYGNLTIEGIDPFIASVLLHPGSKAIEFTGLKADGSEFPVEVSLSSWTTAGGVYYSAIVRDITLRKSLEEQLTHQALHDPLTKLANRLLFRNRVSHALSRVARTHAPVGVLFLDLDNFKNINDTLGHAAGDELLLAVARRIESCLRTSDTAARLGGDEFAVLVEEAIGLDGPILVADRIRETLRDPFTLDGKDMFVGASIGIATAAEGHESPEELLRNADVAMYMAKSQGKDRYAVFASEMHEALVKTAQLESDLRTAIYREEFEIYYQPIVDLASNQIMGTEALVRWNHPEHGLIAPGEFIPVAEQTNLILPLGRWILHEACQKMCEWQERFEFGERLAVSVNISSRQLQDSAMLRTIEECLAMSGLPPESLILELTETTMLMNTESTTQKFAELKKLGVRLAIDDFGTGYSSLSCLHRFPVDILKIDKTFVDGIELSTQGAAVANAIVTMSKTLKLRTIAEESG